MPSGHGGCFAMQPGNGVAQTCFITKYMVTACTATLPPGEVGCHQGGWLLRIQFLLENSWPLYVNNNIIL